MIISKSVVLKALAISCIFLSLISCKTSNTDNKTTSEFKYIFNGKNLNGWNGDPVYWKVENGSLIGEVTPETILKRNSFIIYEKEQPDDFELKLEYKISETGNSGINYRSEIIKDISYALRISM